MVQSLGITLQGKQGTTCIQIEFVCVTSSFFVGGGGGEDCGRSKETVIIFHVTVNIWGLSGWLMTESLLRWNQEKVFVYWCQSFSDGPRRWWIVGSGSDYPLHWHPLIPPPIPLLFWKRVINTHKADVHASPAVFISFDTSPQASAESEVAWQKTPGTHSKSGSQKTTHEPQLHFV